MKLSIISNTGIPAVLPEDPHHFSIYGSEVQNAVLVKGLAQKHQIEWYAPKGSTTLGNFHPIVDSNGQHLQSELLEDISFGRAKTTDILDTDFLLDMSKQCHVSEELSMWHDFTRYANFRSGYRDWIFPQRCEPHHVTHCEYFKEFFEKNGHPAEVAKFGISDFWRPAEDEYQQWIYTLGLDEDGGPYFLYPHRPNPEKGALTFIRLARQFPEFKFVVQTGLKFEDHFREWNAFKERCQGLSNMIFLELPQNIHYQKYRRALMRNAAAVFSLFDESYGYMDTGGLVGAEAVRCGTPLIVTRGKGSEELFGSLEDKGVTFCDGYESAKMAIKFKTFETRPNVGREFWSIDSYVQQWENIIRKWS